LVGFVALGISVYQDYGIAWDEPPQVTIAQVNWSYIRYRDSQLHTSQDPYYGPAYEVLLLRLTEAQDTRKMVLQRHLFNFLFFVMGLAAFFWLARRLLASSWLAWIACLCLMLSPRIFADSFYNTKDIPFMVVFIIAMLSMVLFLDRPNWITAILHGGFSAFLIAIRVPGIIIPAMTFVFLVARWIFQRRPARVVSREGLAGSIYLVFTLGLTIFFWPILWENPLGKFINSLYQMSHYPWGSDLLYLGRAVKPSQLPWHYIPVWISISTPLLYLASFGVGLLTLLINWVRKAGGWLEGEKRNYLIILIGFFGPLLAVVGLHANLYDAWRQMFFIYPPFLLAATLGMRSIYRLLRRCLRPSSVIPAALILLAVGLLEPVMFMVRNHPYENVYFNRLAGDNMAQIKQNFELDYWGLAFKQGIDYILKSDPERKIPIYITLPPGKMYIQYLLPINLKDRLVIKDAPEQARYFLGNYRTHPDEYPYRDKIYSADVGGTSILSVFDLRGEPGNQSQ
jgi:hypothetical protein